MTCRFVKFLNTPVEYIYKSNDQKQSLKVALQLYWKHTPAWVFSCKFAAYFQNTLLWKQPMLNAFEWLKFEYLHSWYHTVYLNNCDQRQFNSWKRFLYVNYYSTDEQKDQIKRFKMCWWHAIITLILKWSEATLQRSS